MKSSWLKNWWTKTRTTMETLGSGLRLQGLEVLGSPRVSDLRGPTTLNLFMFNQGTCGALSPGSLQP